jgi:sentrin-specific protease 8
MSNTKIILDYHDSLLYESDVHLLEPSQWLNDKIIGFIYEYFENDKYERVLKSNFVACLNPSLVQLIKLTQDTNEAIMCFMDPLELKIKNYILIPINDNRSEDVGGSHWSLLFIDRNSKIAYHLDSFGGSNRKIALEFYQKYKNYFNCETIQEFSQCPQQINTCDCGMYVVAFSEAILKSIEAKQENNKFLEFSIITPQYICELRKYYKELIYELAK